MKTELQNKTQKRNLDLGTMVYGKVPPQAKDLEEVVLGAIMLEKDAYDIVSSYLKPECFYVDAHQRIYTAMRALVAQSQPVDILTVKEELRKRGELEMVGGAYYVTKLTNAVVSAANIESHSRIIIQKYMQREIIRISGELISEAYEDMGDPLELLDKAEVELSKVTESLAFGDMTAIDKVLVKTIQHMETLREEARKKNGNIMVTGVPSGIASLDILTRGWQNGDLIIIAARPSVGKTAFVLNTLRHAGMYFKNKGVGSVAMWSLEMRSIRLMLRMLAASSEIWLSKIQTGLLSEHEMKQIYARGVQLLSQLNIFFDDNPGLNIQKLRTKARKLKSKNQLGLIIIDYLQLMTPDDSKGSNREQEVSKISRSLKMLAQELDVPIIALSQLSREVEKRSNNEPQLSDLRESGAIEQDADLVMFLFGYLDSEIAENIELKDRRKIKVAKARDGMLDVIEVDFRGDIQLFREIEKIPAFDTGNWRPVTHQEKGDDLPFG